MATYRATIEFSTESYEKALEAFQMMMETFCNQNELKQESGKLEVTNG